MKSTSTAFFILASISKVKGDTQFEVVGQNLKCPYGSAERLFRTKDNNPLTIAECHQKCWDTPGCHYFTLGVNPSSDKWKGICMGCTADSVLQAHSGFTSYEMNKFKETPSNDYSLRGTFGK